MDIHGDALNDGLWPSIYCVDICVLHGHAVILNVSIYNNPQTTPSRDQNTDIFRLHRGPLTPFPFDQHRVSRSEDESQCQRNEPTVNRVHQHVDLRCHEQTEKVGFAKKTVKISKQSTL